ncbi:hypothetical protein FSP39_024685 [Pinctada imbricata]|uniref:Transmembrane protein 26 n=1 Tax=Pinctada imbricata TaxID=66713 RepID=A0AA88XJJ4_PINIB|nr:hypothetical protein FSP39_024685 [Pinctada imbricata]
MNTSLYDKRDDFNFSITNFPFLSSNIPSSPAYGVFISQLIRYARANTKYTDFVLRARRLSDKLLSQGYVCDRLTSSLRKFYGRYGELVIYYDVPLSRMVTLPFELDKDTWVRVLEQFLLVLIFIGRWLLPHRALSQDQLSTVILIYIGPAFDVMELLIIFEEPVVRNDKSLSLAIFIVWTVSFLQFTLLLPLNGKQQEAASDESENDGCCMCCDYEVLGLIIYTLLMDIPFFVVRMYAIITHQLFKDGLILFAAKNFIVIFFTMYTGRADNSERFLRFFVNNSAPICPITTKLGTNNASPFIQMPM